jgi:transcriptional regulator of acetoin/glycerol metabolism
MSMLTLRNTSVDFWEKHAPYVAEGRLPDSIDDPILRSWHRAAAVGVRPDGVAHPEGVDHGTLISLRAELDEVCTVGARLLDSLSSELSRKNMIALLADARGTILLARGGGEFGRMAARTRLVEGAQWSETTRGTNAIGTAIVERCPVSVVGRAHYEKVNHGLFCYAVPLSGPTGDVIAVIDITGRIEDEDPFAELAVTSVAYRLDHSLRTHRATQERSVTVPVSVATAARQVERDPFGTLFGTDPALIQSREVARKVARSDLPVLLLAETGTGKELLARAVHAASDRARRPFVAINCGAVAPTLLESELFGFAPGSFTGARAGGYTGKVGAATAGTLFLDEVAETPAPLQAALLRLLDEGTYYPVGDNHPHKADIRLVCATCRDLTAMVAAGTFRSDLYYRIKGATVSLPPLRARTDRALLARELLACLARERGVPCPELSSETVALIESAPWPGNVRELKTALHHGLVLSRGADLLTPDHLPPDVVASPHPTQASAHDLSRRHAEKSLVEDALLQAAGNLSDAARRLGVARTTLYRLIRRHGLAGGC